MKKWLFYVGAVVLVAALGYMPFHGSDVAALQPVELIRVDYDAGIIKVQTDTGDMGKGETVAAAFADLKSTTAGEVFLDTADFLLLHPNALPFLQELTQILRPACKVCFVQEQVDLEKAAEYLRVKRENVTLQEYRTGKGSVPHLIVDEERLRLVSEEG